MSKRFTIITKDGSKWLRPVNPFDNNDPRFTSKEPFCILGMRPCSKTVCECDEWKKFEKNNLILPYIGSRPEGTAVYESEVREVRQFKDNGEWVETSYENYMEDDELGLPVRTAYTDAEPPDIDYEKEMPHKQWPSTNYVARKTGSTPFNTQNVRPLVNQLVGEEISFSRFIELLNEIANDN